MHKTVLLNEAIDNLNVKEDGIYVDATLGFGGHSGLILKRIKRGFLFAFDQDDMAIEYSKKKLEEIGSNFEIIKANFVNLEEELNKRGITRIDGIVFDLGVSSPQLDIPERGFSYHNDAPLDMRMVLIVIFLLIMLLMSILMMIWLGYLGIMVKKSTPVVLLKILLKKEKRVVLILR